MTEAEKIRKEIVGQLRLEAERSRDRGDLLDRVADRVGKGDPFDVVVGEERDYSGDKLEINGDHELTRCARLADDLACMAEVTA